MARMNKTICAMVFLAVIFSSINLISAQSGTVNISFYTTSQTCYKTATSAIWGDLSSGLNTTVFASGVNLGNCSLYAISGAINPCCPIDYQCNTTSGNCYVSSVSRCGQYTDAISCNSALESIAKNSVTDSSKCGASSIFIKAGIDCVNRTECYCKWDASNGCLGIKNYSLACDPSQGGTLTPLGVCSWLPAVETNLCNTANPKIQIMSRADWYPPAQTRPADCTDLLGEYPCISLAKLDFWTDFSIIAVVLFIVAVYAFLSKKEYL